MKHDDYKEGLKKTAESTEAKLVELFSERTSLAKEITRIDKEIARVKKYLIGTIQMIEGTSNVQLPPNLAKILAKRDQAGLKEKCIEVLKAAYEPLTATEVIKELQDIGYSLEYKKPLAVVSTTLKRLVESQEVRPTKKDGKTAYKWIGSENKNGEFSFD
jgi:predicted Zn-ribbon and HTH transcriptional regulator